MIALVLVLIVKLLIARRVKLRVHAPCATLITFLLMQKRVQNVYLVILIMEPLLLVPSVKRSVPNAMGLLLIVVPARMGII